MGRYLARYLGVPHLTSVFALQHNSTHTRPCLHIPPPRIVSPKSGVGPRGWGLGGGAGPTSASLYLRSSFLFIFERFSSRALFVTLDLLRQFCLLSHTCVCGWRHCKLVHGTVRLPTQYARRHEHRAHSSQVHIHDTTLFSRTNDQSISWAMATRRGAAGIYRLSGGVRVRLGQGSAL